MTWRGKTKEGTFAVEFHASVLKAMDRYCRDARSAETGGILVGRYSEDLSLAIVSEATPPPTDSKKGRSWFVRGVDGLRELLAKRWRAGERTFYVGEWHFHPVDRVEPSGDDFAQMLEISRAREYNCKEPLLLILGAGKHGGMRVFRAFVCPAGDPPLEFYLANAEQQTKADSEGGRSQ
jgi:integrative and conjugative element protein (TIGR02256 family)